jgi:hypothetical protein
MKRTPLGDWSATHPVGVVFAMLGFSGIVCVPNILTTSGAMRTTLLMMWLSIVPIAFVMWGHPYGLVYKRYMKLRATQEQASDHP